MNEYQRTARIEIRMTQQERQWLEALARANDRSLSSTVRELIRHVIQSDEYIKRIAKDGSLIMSRRPDEYYLYQLRRRSPGRPRPPQEAGAEKKTKGEGNVK
jgi:predicted DNA-binding protein